MLTLGFIDDGIGVCAAIGKVARQLPCKCIALVPRNYSFVGKRTSELNCFGTDAVSTLFSLGCNGVVFSSCLLSLLCKRSFLQNPSVYFCEVPLLHASSYTASSVVVFAEKPLLRTLRYGTAIAVDSHGFDGVADTGNQRQICNFIEDKLRPHFGKFDCIALSSGSMSLNKSCFKMACPNVQIFDCFDGVARKLKRNFRKRSVGEFSVHFVGTDGKERTDLSHLAKLYFPADDPFAY